MVRYSKDDVIDYNLYEHYLQKNGNRILYDQPMLVKVAHDYLYDAVVLESMAYETMIQRSGGKCLTMYKPVIIRYLQDYEGCPQHYFKKKGTQSESLDSKKCLAPLKSNGYAAEFLEYYMQHRSYKAISDKLTKMTKTCRSSDVRAYDGTMLSKLPFTVKREPNSRYNYSDYDIIAQIPKKHASCIGVEDGYVLAWGDFAQSDFRIAYNLFLRSPEHDEIMMKYDDKYEGLARMMCLQSGQQFDLETFKSERQLYKVNTLAAIYGTGGSVVKDNAEFIAKLNKFLVTCPRYVEYKERLKLLHKSGLPITLTSYFGDEETSPTFYDEASTVNRALNAPIQKCTSEIVILTVCKILKRFYDLGYTEDDISVLFVRHDEPIFRVKKEALKDAWIFKDFETIFVGGWTPLGMSFEFGHRYCRPDEELMKQYEEVCKANENKISIVTPEIAIEDYFPVKQAKGLVAYFVKIDTAKYGIEGIEPFTIASLYSQSENAAHSMLIMSTDDNDIINALMKEVATANYSPEVGVIIVQNTVAEKELFNNGHYVKFRIARGFEYYRVSSIVKNTAYKFCKAKGGVEVPEFKVSDKDLEFLSTVQTIKEMSK